MLRRGPGRRRAPLPQRGGGPRVLVTGARSGQLFGRWLVRGARLASSGDRGWTESGLKGPIWVIWRGRPPALLMLARVPAMMLRLSRGRCTRRSVSGCCSTGMRRRSAVMLPGGWVPIPPMTWSRRPSWSPSGGGAVMTWRTATRGRGCMASLPGSSGGTALPGYPAARVGAEIVCVSWPGQTLPPLTMCVCHSSACFWRDAGASQLMADSPKGLALVHWQ